MAATGSDTSTTSIPLTGSNTSSSTVSSTESSLESSTESSAATSTQSSTTSSTESSTTFSTASSTVSSTTSSTASSTTSFTVSSTESFTASSTVSSTESSMTVTIAVVIFLLVVVVAVVIVVIVLLLLLRWRKQKREGGYNSTVSMQAVAKANNDMNLSVILEKTAEYEDEDLKNPLYSTLYKGMSNSCEVVGSKKPHSAKTKPSDAVVCHDGANYSSIDIDSNHDVYNTLSRGHAAESGNSNSIDIDSNHDVYNTLSRGHAAENGNSNSIDIDSNQDVYNTLSRGHAAENGNSNSIDIDSSHDVYNTLSRGHAAESGNSNSTYSKLGGNTAGSIYSVPNANCEKTSSTSPSHIYSTVNIPVDRKPKTKHTQDLWSDETGEEAPRYPEKTQELQQYLDMKLLDLAPHDNENAVGVANDIYSLPSSSTNKISSLTRPAISTGSLSHNLLYFSIETEIGSSGAGNTVTDVVYAEPDVSIAAETCQFPSLENIYESIYSEPLQPSHFMQEPDDTENINDLCPYSSIYSVPVIATTQEKALEVTMENIREDVTLGSGNFGSVILAHTVGLSHYDLKIGESTDKTISVQVAVKMLKDGSGESTKKQFAKEYRFMFRLNHPNVIRLLGICMTETSFIMMEYMENGDLNQILQHQYHTIVDEETIPGEGEITLQMLIHICTQIASAMNYLASNNFVHRDLATRNCLVGENFHVKISDFGMSRSLYESHYYIIRGRAILPIRWMAAECFYGKFSAKTDVWAFGITMWEIFMLAKEEPYYEMSDRDLIQNAIRGPERLLLSCPEGCPHNVYEIMNRCWTHEASKRATFEQLHKKLLSLE